MSALHTQFPGTDIYQTECSGSQSSDPANTFSDTLKWHARNLEIGSTRNWSKTVVNWNIALDPSGGPHVGGCGTCTGILTVGPGDTVTPDAEYYALGHLSRFVQPGAVRIASTSSAQGWNGQIMDVAFVNPSGSTVLVAHNENDSPQSFSVSKNGQSFDYTLPGGSRYLRLGHSADAAVAGARPVRLAGGSGAPRPGQPVLHRRCRQQRGGRRRLDPLLHWRITDARPVPAGRPGACQAAGSVRPGHRREHR